MSPRFSGSLSHRLGSLEVGGQGKIKNWSWYDHVGVSVLSKLGLAGFGAWWSGGPCGTLGLVGSRWGTAAHTCGVSRGGSLLGGRVS